MLTVSDLDSVCNEKLKQSEEKRHKFWFHLPTHLCPSLQSVLALAKASVFACKSESFLSHSLKGSICWLILLSVQPVATSPSSKSLFYSPFLPVKVPFMSYFFEAKSLTSIIHILSSKFFQQTLKDGPVMPWTLLRYTLHKVLASLYCWTQLSVFILHLHWPTPISFFFGGRGRRNCQPFYSLVGTQPRVSHTSDKHFLLRYNLELNVQCLITHSTLKKIPKCNGTTFKKREAIILQAEWGKYSLFIIKACLPIASILKLLSTQWVFS